MSISISIFLSQKKCKKIKMIIFTIIFYDINIAVPIHITISICIYKLCCSFSIFFGYFLCISHFSCFYIVFAWLTLSSVLCLRLTLTALALFAVGDSVCVCSVCRRWRGVCSGGPVTTQAPESRRQLHANSMAALFIIQSQA